MNFSDIPLKSSNVIIKTYSEEELDVLGKIYVEVSCNSKKHSHMKVLVLKGTGVNLLGRNWLNVMQLDWNSVIRPTTLPVYNTVTSGISNETNIKLKSLLDEYSAVFSKKLGKLVGFKAKLNVKENPVPKFMKARPVPYALKEAVSKEIE